MLCQVSSLFGSLVSIAWSVDISFLRIITFAKIKFVTVLILKGESIRPARTAPVRRTTRESVWFSSATCLRLRKPPQNGSRKSSGPTAASALGADAPILGQPARPHRFRTTVSAARSRFPSRSEPRSRSQTCPSASGFSLSTLK